MTPVRPQAPTNRRRFFMSASLGALGGAGGMVLPAPAPAVAGPVSDGLLFNVLELGAVGDGVADDTAAIQAAIQAASARGGVVYLPPVAVGYKTTNTLVVRASNVMIRGAGIQSAIVAMHDGDTIAFDGSQATDAIYFNEVSGIFFNSINKKGGNDVRAYKVAQFTLSQVKMFSGWCGFYLQNFNTVTIRDVIINGYRSLWGGLLAGGDNGVGRSDVAYLHDVSMEGRGANSYGLLIDGFVHTVTAVNLFFLSMPGSGLWVRNTVGAVNLPTFLNFYGLQSEYSRLEAVRLDSACRVLLSDAQMHGSKTTHNLYIGPGARSVSLSSGYSSGAAGSGIACDGTDVMLSGVLTQWNQAAGITLGSQSSGVVISGCRSGSLNPAEPAQPWGCRVDAGAKSFVIVGNNFAGNLHRTPAGGISNSAGISTTQVVANNI